MKDPWRNISMYDDLDTGNSEYEKLEKLLFEKSLKLSQDIPNDLQKFYDELEKPFFHSLTREQIDKLAPLQFKLWNDHFKHNKILVLKSQKIGISSICILITLWHAIKDCRGMELIINAQSDEQAKTHAHDLRQILLGSNKYRDYLITKNFSAMGLLKDEVTKVRTIWIHNPDDLKRPTKIIIVGMSPGALLSHKKVAFVWSSDITISDRTPEQQNRVWAALLSRVANSQGPVIVECPARAPSGPVYDEFDRYEKSVEQKGKQTKKSKRKAKHAFHVEIYGYELGLRDKFFTKDFIDSEKIRLGPLFGTFYNADFFASGSTWYKPEHFDNETQEAADMWMMFNPTDDTISDVTDD
ncbi:MAG: hypothetical protein HY223_03330 [Thaumarchaeota archaeon]|nr:hypothetical protein [Nitrososphaerota archaeon]